jgi:putative intracellular protease/amidase
MTDRRPKIAALVADAFQEEEYFFPKIALNEAGYQVEVVSSRKEPVEIYSYFTRTGLLDVQGAIMEARPEVESSLVSPNPAAQCQSDLARSGTRTVRVVERLLWSLPTKTLRLSYKSGLHNSGGF